MILVFYLFLMPMNFEFSGEGGLSSPKRVSPFFRRFPQVSSIASLSILSMVVAGSFLPERKKHRAEKTPAAPAKNQSAGARGGLSLPPLLVSLKGEDGIRMARINVNLQVSRRAVRREILSNNKAARKRLLILLSGQKSRDLQNKKAHFEKQLLSWMNAFLSKGSVNKVTIQTTFLN